MPFVFLRAFAVFALLPVLIACSAAESDDLDVETSQRRAVEKELGIRPQERVQIRDGSRILFFGDSITVGGTDEGGYVTLVADAIKGLYPDRRITVRGSGVVGDKVSDLQRRLSRDVLARRPTHVVIYVGVNDVASMGPGQAALAEGEAAYREGLTELVTRIQGNGAWVMICTPGVIGENVDEQSDTNIALERYAEAARAVAQEKGAGLCDLRKEFTDYLRNRNLNGRRSGLLTVDGIHLNLSGNRLVATTMLRALVTTATPVPIPQGPEPSEPPSPRATRSRRPAPVATRTTDSVSDAPPSNPAATPAEDPPSPSAEPEPTASESSAPEPSETPDAQPSEESPTPAEP
ncbi:MAG TPA: SGNH/GDSL hydrolase family protein [Actinomycetota bacterium]|nr:SGNH/GDSL hydrolase family protein [Actinomycetota bacterium]